MLRLLKISTLLIAVIYPGITFGEEGWKFLKTKHTIVHYRAENDLKVFERKLKMGSQLGLSVFSRRGSGYFVTLLQQKIDRIFESNQTQLQMNGTENRIHIHLHSNQKEVNRAYSEIIRRYGIEPSSHEKHIAFYFHRENAVHVSLEKVTEGVLAHELGHAIIDHHFIIRPPQVVGEILAQYAEKHLKRW